ncbi:MAG TPA: TRAP transporter small permease [Methylomirabilota bacterium]|nr:TRAP transporter small permease [Methylomirabilota bacterium]
MSGRLARLAATVAGLAVLAIVLLITYDVLMRFLFEQPQLFVDEAASFLEVLVIFGGLAFAFRTGAHVRVDLITTHLPPRARARLRAVGLLIGLVFLGIVIWTTAQSALTAFRYGRVSAVMLYPLWLPMLLIPLGLALFAVVMVVALARQLRALRSAEADEVPVPETAE